MRSALGTQKIQLDAENTPTRLLLLFTSRNGSATKYDTDELEECHLEVHKAPRGEDSLNR